MFKFLGGPILESQFWRANFGEPIWTANLKSQFGPGPKLTSIDEYFSVQLWIKVHKFL